MFGSRKSDAVQYLCIGFNKLGHCVQSFQLSVKDNTLSSKAPPEFLNPLHDVDTYIGHTVTSRCKINGYPYPKVLWCKDGKRLRPPNTAKMKIGNRDYVCPLDYVTVEPEVVLLLEWGGG